MAAIGLALLAAWLAGSADFLGGLVSRRIPAASVLVGAYLIELVGFLVAAPLTGQTPQSAHTIFLGLLAGALSGLSLVLLYTALALGPMSIVASISVTAAVIPVVLGFLSGDRLAALQIIGIVAAISGAVMASLAKEGASSSGRPRAAVPLAAGAAIVLGLTLVAIRASGSDQPIWTGVAIRTGGFALLGCAGLLRDSPVFPERTAWAAIGAIAAADAGALLAFVLANRYGSLGVVSTIVSLYPIAIVVLARAVLRERVRPIQGVGIASALLGVALMSAG
jgi:drug/metabolite transporter (DMT)-like permease